MQAEGLTPAIIKANIRAAEKRKAEALAAYQSALAELEWWKQGQRLFGIEPAEDDLSPAAVTELFPSSEVLEGANPTLRQAIVATMRGQPGAHWRVSDLVGALSARGWLPPREDSSKRVSDMAAVMVGDGHLYRVARGVYALAPELAAAFDAPSALRSPFVPRTWTDRGRKE